jgi:hypothetical protein
MALLLHGLALLLGLSFGMAGGSGHQVQGVVRPPVASPADGGGTMPGHMVPADGGGTMPGGSGGSGGGNGGGG